MTRISPALVEYADAWRYELPATPYMRGFDDNRYSHVYVNPYPIGSAEWRQYDNGQADARQASNAERTAH